MAKALHLTMNVSKTRVLFVNKSGIIHQILSVVNSAKMPRKIPARKHHGIRDPIKQNELRMFKIKDQINNPPTAASFNKDNKLSYKLNQLVKLKADAKAGKVKRHRYQPQHCEDKPPDHQKTQKKIQPIVPLEDETSGQYMRRVNRITQEGLKEAEYEAKYGVDVVRDERTGQITIKKRPKDEITELMKENRKNRKRKGPAPPMKPAIDPKEAKLLIKQAIEETNREQKTEKIEEFKRDTFKFGEVVQAPPTLTAPRRARKDETVPRPGKRDSLLLKKMLAGQNEANPTRPETSEKISTIAAKKHRKMDLKGKRKDLPKATRKMIEEQQSRAVEMYREMKKNKIKL